MDSEERGMRRVCFATVLTILLFVSASPGSAMSCTAIVPNYSSLLGLGAAGCTLTTPAGDLLFSNFTFAASSTGTGALPTVGQLSFALDNPGTSTGTGQSIYGFEFNPNLTVANVGSEDIQIQYDITSVSGLPIISSIHLLETALVSGAGSTATVAEGPDVGRTTPGGPATFLPTIIATPANPHQDALGIGPFFSLHVFKDMNVNSNSVAIGALSVASLSNVRDSVDVTIAPEPETLWYLLSGAMMLIVGAFRRTLRN